MPLAAGLQAIASPSGDCQSFSSLHSAGMGRSFGNQALHLGRFPKFKGLLKITQREAPACGRIPMKLKPSGKQSAVLTIYCFGCQDPSGFTSNFCDSLDKILHAAG